MWLCILETAGRRINRERGNILRISTKGRYGTRAMVYLGENFGQEPVSLGELAEKEGVSLKYMEQIVPLLKNSGLIRSVRGPGGGYMLTKKPHKISLCDILLALEGRGSLVDCLSDETVCDRTEECVTYEIWQDIQAAVNKVLDSTTLADMVNRRRKKGRKSPKR